MEVVTHTSDGFLGIRRTFTFVKDRRYVTVATRIENLTGQGVSDLVFKENADWDTDGNFFDNWDYDTTRHLVYASSLHYVGIASEQAPNQMDLYGWNDFDRRVTTVDFPTGPVLNFDGLETLHFDLGALNPSESRDLTFAYGAGNTLADLQSAMDEAVGHPTWLSFSPPGGVVHAGDELTVRARFDAGGLIGGTYRADVHVTSNDPDEADVQLGAALHVTGVPNVAVTPDSIAFGALFVGAVRTDSVQVTNTGSDVLHVSAITVSPGPFVPPPAPFDLAVGESRLLAVRFAPTVAGVFAGTLQITSDAHNIPTASVQLSGEALVAPDIAADPESLSVTLNAGDVVHSPLAILNTGGSVLVWTALPVGATTLAQSPMFGTAGSRPGSTSAPGPATPVSRTYAEPAPPAGSPAPPRVGRTALALEGAGLLAQDPSPAPDGSDAGVAPGMPITAAAIAPAVISSLEIVRGVLDAGFGSITALIPQRFDFTEGDSGASIIDGGGMYANGNFLHGNTGPVPYTNGPIVFHPAFGAGTRYFTRKYPGLFVLAADLNGMSQFTVLGNLPLRGIGFSDGVVLQATIDGVIYRAFVKRVSGNGGPTINQQDAAPWQNIASTRARTSRSNPMPRGRRMS